MKTIAEQIHARITQALNPSTLDVINESHKHNVPKGAETHFKLIVVSTNFESQTLLERHRTINTLLSDLMGQPIHALAIHAYTPNEWQEKKEAPQSPTCRGGSGK